MEIFGVDENCVTPNDGNLIENYCDLKKLVQFAFGEINVTVNKPKVYKLKNFCNKNCTTL